MLFQLKKASSIDSGEKQETYEKLGFKYIKGDIVTYLDETHIPTIEVSTLEQLLKFVSEFGAIVFEENLITIYDGYLE